MDNNLPHAAPDGTGELSGGIVPSRPSEIEEDRAWDAWYDAQDQLREMGRSSMEQDCYEEELDARENRAAEYRYRTTGDAS